MGVKVTIHVLCSSPSSRANTDSIHHRGPPCYYVNKLQTNDTTSTTITTLELNLCNKFPLKLFTVPTLTLAPHASMSLLHEDTTDPLSGWEWDGKGGSHLYPPGYGIRGLPR